jgi:hypothetical protein
MTIRQSLILTVAVTLVGGLIGMRIGFALGHLAPDFYRALFAFGGQRERAIDPVALGSGLGLVQGCL